MFSRMAKGLSNDLPKAWEVDAFAKDIEEKVKAEQLPTAESTVGELIIGLDLGQSKDHAAMTLARRRSTADLPTTGKAENRTPGRYDVQLVKQWPLGTKYTYIVDSLCHLLRQMRDLARPEPIHVVVDASRDRSLVDFFNTRAERKLCHFHPVLITAGQAWRPPDAAGYWTVSKSLLCSIAVVVLETHRITWPKSARPEDAENMAAVAALKRELANFRQWIKTNLNEKFEADKGEHDDILLSLCLILFWGEKAQKRAKVW